MLADAEVSDAEADEVYSSDSSISEDASLSFVRAPIAGEEELFDPAISTTAILESPRRNTQTRRIHRGMMHTIGTHMALLTSQVDVAATGDEEEDSLTPPSLVLITCDDGADETEQQQASSTPVTSFGGPSNVYDSLASSLVSFGVLTLQVLPASSSSSSTGVAAVAAAIEWTKQQGFGPIVIMGWGEVTNNNQPNKQTNRAISCIHEQRSDRFVILLVALCALQGVGVMVEAAQPYIDFDYELPRSPSDDTLSDVTCLVPFLIGVISLAGASGESTIGCMRNFRPPSMSHRDGDAHRVSPDRSFLFLHGGADGRIPLRCMDELYAAIPFGCNKMKHLLTYDSHQLESAYKVLTTWITKIIQARSEEEQERIREMIENQSQLNSPLKQSQRRAHHADLSTEESHTDSTLDPPPSSDPYASPTALHLLDPSHLLVDAPLSRVERTPVLARLVQRLHRKEQQALNRGMASSQTSSRITSTPNTHTNNLRAAASLYEDDSAMPNTAIDAITQRLRTKQLGSVSPPSALSVSLLQQSVMTPLAPYSSLYRPPKKIDLLMRECMTRVDSPAQAELECNKKLPTASSSASISASSRPPDPLSRVTSQLRIRASLDSMLTHQFESRGMPFMHAHTSESQHEDSRVAFESILNRLYVERINPKTLADEAQRRAILYDSIVRTNSIRIGMDLYQSANKR